MKMSPFLVKEGGGNRKKSSYQDVSAASVAQSDHSTLSNSGYLLGAGKPYYALALLGLLLPQVYFQVWIWLANMLSYESLHAYEDFTSSSVNPFFFLCFEVLI